MLHRKPEPVGWENPQLRQWSFICVINKFQANLVRESYSETVQLLTVRRARRHPLLHQGAGESDKTVSTAYRENCFAQLYVERMCQGVEVLDAHECRV